MLARSIAFTSLAVSLIAASAGGSSAQTDWEARCQRSNGRGDRETFCDERESRIPARATLTVDAGANGGVSVEGSNEAGILVQARVQAWAATASEAREIAQQVRVSTDGTLRASGPAMRGRSGWAVSWQLRVPRRTSLQVETQNGPISVADVSGRMQLSAQNGPLSLTRIGGDVHGRTVNGPLSVTLAGSRWSGEGLDVATTNGPLVLRVPRGYSAELEAGTVNGPMSVDLGRTVSGRGRHSRRLHTTLGDGGPPVRAVTTNGPVSIRES